MQHVTRSISESIRGIQSLIEDSFFIAMDRCGILIAARTVQRIERNMQSPEFFTMAPVDGVLKCAKIEVDEFCFRCMIIASRM